MKNDLKTHIKDYLKNTFNIDANNQDAIVIEENEIFLTLHNIQIDVSEIQQKLHEYIKTYDENYKLYISFTKSKVNNPIVANRVKVPYIKNIILISSGKGGVGKSTATINLAYAMAHLGKRVGILDGDIYGPSIKFMMGDANPILDDTHIKTFIKDGIIFNSVSSFIQNEDDAIILKAPIILKIFNQLLMESKWGNLDYLFIDLSPGTGDLHINLALKYQISGSIVICTPQKLALLDATKAINMWQKTNVEILGLIENMSAFVCGNCSHITHIFDNNKLIEVSKKHNIPLLGNIPLDVSIRHYSDNQTNVIKEDPKSIISQEFLNIANNLIAILNKV
jgi:ATP-binding protein involved in chromosome partitioning